MADLSGLPSRTCGNYANIFVWRDFLKDEFPHRFVGKLSDEDFEKWFIEFLIPRLQVNLNLQFLKLKIEFVHHLFHLTGPTCRRGSTQKKTQQNHFQPHQQLGQLDFDFGNETVSSIKIVQKFVKILCIHRFSKLLR